MIKPNCLRDRHVLADFPQFPCPKCESALLPVDKKLDCQQSAESKFHQEYVDSGPEYFVGVFSLLLRCSNRSCGEAVFCVGDFHHTEEETPDGESHYVPSIRPIFFTPTLRIFPVPKEKVPDRVAKPLLDSFSLFWSNPSAAGNSLRVAIEALMDYRGVKKWVVTQKGNEEPMSLHSRILEFQKSKPSLAEKLLAIKWIGNGGSHLSGLGSKDMVVAYRLMEHVLDELFNRTSEDLDRIAKRINRKKKA